MKVEELSLVSSVTSYIQSTVSPILDSVKPSVAQVLQNLISELEEADSILEARETIWRYYKQLLKLYGNRKTYLTGLLWGIIVSLDAVWDAKEGR